MAVPSAKTQTSSPPKPDRRTPAGDRIDSTEAAIVSKSSRRARRSGNRPTGDAGPAAAGSGRADNAGPMDQADAAAPDDAGTTTPRDDGRRSGRSSRPAGSRAGRRERARPMPKPSLLERYRILIVGGVVIAVVALLGAMALRSTSAASYTCSSEFQPGTTPPPASDTAGDPGYVQPDMGNRHETNLGATVTYTYCPPATGPHYNLENRGPVAYRVYGPGDAAVPQGWVHNLEHGALVVLYRGREGDPGLSEETQEQIRAFAASAPTSPVCGRPASQYLIAARFDDMATPFAALVWGRVLPLDSFDEARILGFWNSSGETALTMPERFGCPLPGEGTDASPSPG